MRNRLAFRFSVEGEARFLSHHDMMRLMERAAARARLPLRFSQGFNPRPRISLPLPRPVGVAARDDVLLLELETPVEPREALDRLAVQLPEAVTLTDCQAVDDRQAFHAVAADYELALDADRADAARRRLEELAAQDAWPWTRRGGKGDQPLRPIDLKPLIARAVCEAAVLRFTLQPLGQQWARAEEVLGLLGLDEQLDRARLIRTAIRWAGQPD